MAEVMFTWNGQSAGFDFDSLTFGEAEQIERFIDGPLKDFRQQLIDGFTSAKKVAIWVAFHRDNPDMRLSDLDGAQLSDVTWEIAEVDADPQVPGDGPGDTSV